MVTLDGSEGAFTFPIWLIDWCVSITFSFNKKVRRFKVFSSISVVVVVELRSNRWNTVVERRHTKNQIDVLCEKMICESLLSK